MFLKSSYCHLSSIVCLLSSVFCSRPSTLVEMPLQITPFYAKQTQFPKKSNERKYLLYKGLSNYIPLAEQKNKPNSNPIKPNLQKAKMNITSIITKDYRKKDDFEVRINKPNSNPISETPKMNVNLYILKDYRK